MTILVLGSASIGFGGAMMSRINSIRAIMVLSVMSLLACGPGGSGTDTMPGDAQRLADGGVLRDARMAVDSSTAIDIGHQQDGTVLARDMGIIQPEDMGFMQAEDMGIVQPEDMAFVQPDMDRPPECGDGTLDEGEMCDDNNQVDGDGCDSNCTETACGNGITTEGEACDDGNLVAGDGCDPNCTETGCGNRIQTEGEACEDGNGVDGDGCDSNCTETACGNGIATEGEGCDDGNDVEGDGCDSNCTETSCGNGIQTEGEACDDGNGANGDGCDNNCTVTACGNGVVTEGEICDDGNELDDDGCDTNCLFSGCGNGRVSEGEACDDGNRIDGDGCDSNCRATGCGNGIVFGDELCDDGNDIADDRCDNTCTPTPCAHGPYATPQWTDGFPSERFGVDGRGRVRRLSQYLEFKDLDADGQDEALMVLGNSFTGRKFECGPTCQIVHFAVGVRAGDAWRWISVDLPEPNRLEEQFRGYYLGLVDDDPFVDLVVLTQSEDVGANGRPVWDNQYVYLRGLGQGRFDPMRRPIDCLRRAGPANNDYLFFEDMDGDGIRDAIAVAGDIVWNEERIEGSGVYWCPGLGQGRFDEVREAGLHPDDGRGNSQVMANSARPQLRDINGDGRVDFVGGRNTYLFLNLPAGLLKRRLGFGNVPGLPEADQSFINGTFFNSAIVADMDGDRALDGVFLQSHGDRAGVVVLFNQNNAGWHPEDGEPPRYHLFRMPTYDVQAGIPRKLFVEDLNGDARPDIIVVTHWPGEPTMRIGWNQGGGAFQWMAVGDRSIDLAGQTASELMYWSALVDLDFDGDRDLLLDFDVSGQVKYTPNLGMGQFGQVARGPIDPEDLTRYFSAHDVDGDGRDELLGLRKDGALVYVVATTQSDEGPRNILNLRVPLSDLARVDDDVDNPNSPTFGHQAVIEFTPNNEVAVMPDEALSVCSDAQCAEGTCEQSVWFSRRSDPPCEGELATHYSLFLYERDAAGDFGLVTGLSFPTSQGRILENRDLKFGDFNGDEQLDYVLYVHNPRSAFIIRYGTEQGFSEISHVLAMGETGPIVADLNNDGVDDLLALESSFMDVAYGREGEGLQFTIPAGGDGVNRDFAINDTRFQFWARDEDVPLRDGEDLIDAQRRLLKIAAVGDLNGDGYTDGVRPLGNGQLAIYLGAENAVPGEVIDGPNFDRNGALRFIEVAPTLLQAIDLPSGDVLGWDEASPVDHYDAVQLSDVNGDGHLDVVLGERRPQGQPFLHKFILIFGVGDGTFDVENPKAWDYPCTDLYQDCLFFADLDGEGLKTIITWNTPEDLVVQDGIQVGGTTYIEDTCAPVARQPPVVDGRQ